MADNENKKPNKQDSIGIETGLETNVITNESAKRYKWIFVAFCGVLAIALALNALGVFSIAPRNEDDPDKWYDYDDRRADAKTTAEDITYTTADSDIPTIDVNVRPGETADVTKPDADVWRVPSMRQP